MKKESKNTENTENSSLDKENETIDSIDENEKLNDDIKNQKKENKEEPQDFEHLYYDLKDSHLRLTADFENFRRRTRKEKLNTISHANEKLMVSILPIIDDFERFFANQSSYIESKIESEDQEGMKHIYNKLMNILAQKGLVIMKVSKGDEFDPDKCEAITKTQAGDSLKDKVVDIIENGYILNNKIIRFAKVIIGE